MNARAALRAHWRPLATVAACAVLGVGACVTAPAPLAPSPAAPRRPAAAIPAGLAARVEVSLDGGVGPVTSLRATTLDGLEHTARRTAEGIALDRRPPARRVVLPGPVRIGDTLHAGDLVLEPAPGTPDRLRASVSLPLEAYVAGVVAAELALWSSEPAELAALSIAARTYAVRAMAVRARSASGSTPRLTDGVLDQAYRGAYVPAPGSRQGEAVRARLEAAVSATAGVVLARGELLEDVRYHASCGGRTAALLDVFGDEPDIRTGAPGVACLPCTERARNEARARRPDPERPLGWVAELGPGDLARAASAAGLTAPAVDLRAAREDRAGRWLEAEVVGSDGSRATLDTTDLRRALGFTKIPGSLIVATRRAPDGTLLVQGRGRGHGVGLCQESLRDLARAGWDHRRILAHYLPDTRLVRLDTIAP